MEKSSTPEEISKLHQEQRLEELSEAIMATEVNKTLAKQWAECGRILGEHAEEELIRCIKAWRGKTASYQPSHRDTSAIPCRHAR